MGRELRWHCQLQAQVRVFAVFVWCEVPEARLGRNFLETSQTNWSISQWSTSSTVSCRTISRSTPPSPPPMTATRFGFRCAHIGIFAIICRAAEGGEPWSQNLAGADKRHGSGSSGSSSETQTGRLAANG